MLSMRLTYFLGFAAIMGLMGFVLLLEYQGLAPCPLCLLQRIIMILLGGVFFIGMLRSFKKAGHIILNSMGILLTLSGMLLAGRQVVLQYMPPAGNGECEVSLQYLLSILPFMEVIKKVWQGGTECSATGWVFLHLSLAEWSLVIFGLFFIFIILQLKRSLAS